MFYNEYRKPKKINVNIDYERITNAWTIKIWTSIHDYKSK